MLNDSSTKDVNLKVVTCAQFLETSPQLLPTVAKAETLVGDVKSSCDEEQAP